MTHGQAISTYNGKRVDVDYFPKTQPYQCYDWAVKYMQRTSAMRGNPSMRWSGGVKDFAEHFSSITAAGKPLSRYYSFIKNNPNSPSQIPRRGDIVVFSGRLPGSGGYGHISVVDSASRSGFTGYDQNWGGAYVHKVRHGYDYVLGWMRERSAPKPASTATYYRVRAGDYMSKIAIKFKTTVSRLLRLNPQVKDANKIYINQKLRVK